MKQIIHALFVTVLLVVLSAEAAPVSGRPDVRLRHVLDATLHAAQDAPVRIVKDPRNDRLYYLTIKGDIYRLDGYATSSASATWVASTGSHTLTDTQGLAIGPEGTMYLVGNDVMSPTTTRGRIMRGTQQPGDTRAWTPLATTAPYPVSSTYYSHRMNGIIVSPDGLWLYVNSGARTDHGEVDDLSGAFPNTRDVGLTSILLRIPTNFSGTVSLPNDRLTLKNNGNVYAEGIRNTFDLAFAPNCDLFGTENSGDRDVPDEVNWLRRDHHYGFPWRMGGDDNPQQFSGYDPSKDKLLDPRYGASQLGLFHNDPTFPQRPAGLVLDEPVANWGPEANSYRDPTTGQIARTALGQTQGSVTAHRSPLGLVFDLDEAVSPEFKGHGFMLSWTVGDAAGNSVPGPFLDPGQDLLDLSFIKVDPEHYAVVTTRLVGGFAQPIDSEIVGNKIYVLENAGNHGIWEVTLPPNPAGPRGVRPAVCHAP